MALTRPNLGLPYAKEKFPDLRARVQLTQLNLDDLRKGWNCPVMMHPLTLKFTVDGIRVITILPVGFPFAKPSGFLLETEQLYAHRELERASCMGGWLQRYVEKGRDEVMFQSNFYPCAWNPNSDDIWTWVKLIELAIRNKLRGGNYGREYV